MLVSYIIAYTTEHFWVIPRSFRRRRTEFSARSFSQPNSVFQAQRGRVDSLKLNVAGNTRMGIQDFRKWFNTYERGSNSKLTCVRNTVWPTTFYFFCNFCMIPKSIDKMKLFSSSYFQNAGYKITLGLLENFLESYQNNALLTILFYQL